jgi:hypothetical protein
MRINIDHLSYEELLDLNNRIVERLKLLEQMHAHAEMLRFRIGERVTFAPPGRGPITGVIAKYNRKTVTIVTDGGQRWRVAPDFISRAAGGSGTSSNVVPIRHDTPSGKRGD